MDTLLFPDTVHFMSEFRQIDALVSACENLTHIKNTIQKHGYRPELVQLLSSEMEVLGVVPDMPVEEITKTLDSESAGFGETILKIIKTIIDKVVLFVKRFFHNYQKEAIEINSLVEQLPMADKIDYEKLYRARIPGPSSIRSFDKLLEEFGTLIRVFVTDFYEDKKAPNMMDKHIASRIAVFNEIMQEMHYKVSLEVKDNNTAELKIDDKSLTRAEINTKGMVKNDVLRCAQIAITYCEDTVLFESDLDMFIQHYNTLKGIQIDDTNRELVENFKTFLTLMINLIRLFLRMIAELVRSVKLLLKACEPVKQ